MANKTLKKAVCAISLFAALFSMAVPAANAENVKYTDPFAYAQYYHNDTGVKCSPFVRQCGIIEICQIEI